MVTKILMVCLGNICRSPLAEGILKSKLNQSQYFVDSAGTGNWHIGEAPDHRSIKVAYNRGVDITKQRCRQIKISDLDTFDLIYVMDQSNYKNVIAICENDHQKNKVKLILSENPKSKLKEVPDPYYGDISDFENVFEILDEVCEVITEKYSK